MIDWKESVERCPTCGAYLYVSLPTMRYYCTQCNHGYSCEALGFIRGNCIPGIGLATTSDLQVGASTYAGMENKDMENVMNIFEVQVYGPGEVNTVYVAADSTKSMYVELGKLGLDPEQIGESQRLNASEDNIAMYLS